MVRGMAPKQEQDFLSEFRGMKTSVVRWVWVLISGAFILGGIQANFAWRLYNLEAWKAERVKPIEDYYRDQRILEARMSILETNSNNNASNLKEIKEDLKDVVNKLDQYIFKGGNK